MNDHNAAAIFSNQVFCQNTIYQSPKPTNTVEMLFAMGTKMQPLKALINIQIKIFTESGKLEASLLNHSSNLTFPSSLKCIAVEP